MSALVVGVALLSVLDVHCVADGVGQQNGGVVAEFLHCS